MSSTRLCMRCLEPEYPRSTGVGFRRVRSGIRPEVMSSPGAAAQRLYGNDFHCGEQCGFAVKSRSAATPFISPASAPSKQRVIGRRNAVWRLVSMLTPINTDHRKSTRMGKQQKLSMWLGRGTQFEAVAFGAAWSMRRKLLGSRVHRRRAKATGACILVTCAMQAAEAIGHVVVSLVKRAGRPKQQLLARPIPLLTCPLFSTAQRRQRAGRA